ncbi:MAG: hypothetical protein ABF727_09800 [Gluconobacter oxydans]
MAIPHKDRQRNLRTRDAAAGLRHLMVKVPTERVEELRKIAAKMCEEHFETPKTPVSDD